MFDKKGLRIRGPFFMSLKSIEKAFLPRFVVTEWGPGDAGVLTGINGQDSHGFKIASVTKAQPQDHEGTIGGDAALTLFCKDLKHSLEEQGQSELALICFEDVSASLALTDMLDKLVQAIKFKEYRMYQLPIEVKSLLSLAKLEELLIDVEGSSHTRILIFDSRLERTETKPLGEFQTIWTYSLTALNQNVQFKKDLWVQLQKLI